MFILNNDLLQMYSFFMQNYFLHLLYCNKNRLSNQSYGFLYYGPK